MLADIVVLGEDPFSVTVSAARLHRVEVDATIVGGEVVYRRR